MKTIYNALIERLRPLLDNNTLRWVDWDKGQLKKTGKGQRPDVAYPCALIGINIPKSTDMTDTIQDCRAMITIRLAFDPIGSGRSAANAPDEVRAQSLEPYDVIAEVYKTLQGFGTAHFTTLSRISQGEEQNSELFIYRIVFGCEFEDETADG